MGKKRVGKKKAAGRTTSKRRRSKRIPKKTPWQKLKAYLIPKKAPLGIKALIVYSLFILLLYMFYFFVGIDFPLTIIFAKVLQGTEAALVNLALIISLGFFVYSAIKRKAWGYYLGLLWFLFTVLNSIVSVSLMKKPLFEIMQQLTLFSFFSVLLINGLVIWYIIEERKWFLEKKITLKPVTLKDKMFVYILVGFWVIVILIGAVMGIKTFSDSKNMINDMMLGMINKEYQEAVEFCNSQQGQDKDVCYVVLATIKHIDDKNDIAELCNNIQSNFYRFTCYRAAS